MDVLSGFFSLMKKGQKKAGSEGRTQLRFERNWEPLRERSSAWIEGVLLVGLIALTLLVFVDSFSAQFTYDDYIFILDNPEIRQFHFLDLFDTSDSHFGWQRQLRTLSFMVDYALFGLEPTGYHVHNLLWHVLSVLLLYFVAKELSHRLSISILVASLFALHPIHVEVVTNITNRKDLLCMAFLLASFLSYTSFIRSMGPKKWVWLTGSLLAWVLALFSKQVAIVLPLQLVVYELLFLPQKQRFLAQYPLILGSGILLGGTLFLTYVFLVVELDNPGNSMTFKGYIGEPTILSAALSSGRAFWRYWDLLIWPKSLCPHHVVALSQSPLDPSTLVSWVGLLVLIGFTFLMGRRWPLLAFGLSWFLVSYLPISNLIPTSYVLADRYMYIPSAGYCLIVVCLGEALYQKLGVFNPRHAFALVAVVGSLLITGYTWKTITYNSYWKDEGRLWRYAKTCQPGGVASYSLGTHYYRKGAYPAAIEELTKAIEYGYMDAFSNRGNAFFAMGKFEEALRDYSLAIAFRPDWAKAFYDRGLVAFQLGYYEKALMDYSLAIKLDSQYSEAYNNRGLVHEKLNRLTEALEDFTQAARIDPYNAAAQNNLGRALFFAGNREAALQSYRRAEQLGLAEATRILELLRQKGISSPSTGGSSGNSREKGNEG